MVMAVVPMMVPGAGELVLGNPRTPEMDRDYSSVTEEDWTQRVSKSRCFFISTESS